MTPTFADIDIGLTTSIVISSKRVYNTETTNNTVGVQGKSFDSSTGTILIDLSPLPAMNYETIVTVSLEPDSTTNLTIGTYKEYVKDKKTASSNNALEVSGYNITLGTDANGKIEIPVENSPDIR